MFNIVIKNGLIIDGNGNPWYKGDVALKDGRIEAIGEISSSKADVLIDASGLIVAPGFIDMHSHSD
ncbi:MAG TPA: D-aminoacylase, partial [Candidatus Bathyarchaeota archaeon]|nr:D-aminoacylase [Candidatus Bathyarchaeota archaeon]